MGIANSFFFFVAPLQELVDLKMNQKVGIGNSPTCDGNCQFLLFLVAPLQELPIPITCGGIPNSYFLIHFQVNTM